MAEFPLREHQQTAIDWIHSVGRGLLGDEPGLGKSRVAIEAFDGGKVLIIAPGMVIRGGTWDDEIEKWAKHPEGFVVAPYSQLNIREKTGTGGTSPTRQVGKRKKVIGTKPEFLLDWDAVVIDEAHYAKGRKTSWTHAVQQITKRAGSVLEMTGTPVPNWAQELFTLLQIVRPEDARPGRALGSYHRWIGEWFKTVPSQFGGPYSVDIVGLAACRLSCADRPTHDPCEHYAEFMRENLGDKFLRRLREDVLTDLPPATRQVVETPLDAGTLRQYRSMKKDYIANVEDGELVAWTIGSRNVWLDRMTTSGWFLEQKGEPRGGKLEQLRFDLENRSRPTLVLAHYRDSVEAAARVAESTGARTAYVHGGLSARDAGERVKAFKRGDLDVLVGSLDLVAEGLTLTVADMVIFLEMSYRPSRNEQATRRVHRLGQTRPVTIREYVTPGTVDERKRELLEGKLDHQLRLLSARQFAELL